MNLSIIRGIIKKFKAPAKRLSRFDASGRIGEEFSDREVFQNYGFASSPKEGAECLLVRSGQNIYMIASDDRRYRIALAEGEVALHDAHGNAVHLQSGGNILIKAAGDVSINAASCNLGNNAVQGVIHAASPCPVFGVFHLNPSQTTKTAL